MRTIHLVPAWWRKESGWEGQFPGWKEVTGPLWEATGHEDIILVQNLNLNDRAFRALQRLPRERMLLRVSEPSAVLPANHHPSYHQYFRSIMTWDDTVVDGDRYVKYCYPSSRDRVKPLPFQYRNLCTLVCGEKASTHASELYSARRRAIEFFEGKPGCDFYGTGWEHHGYSHYRGAPKNKRAILAQYRFCLCYENSRAMGYITEKLFDAFCAGCVPVYLGAPNITEYVPADCFVDREHFSSLEELEAFMRGMSPQEYRGYLERIDDFLTSEAAERFTTPFYFEQLRRWVYHHAAQIPLQVQPKRSIFRPRARGIA